jgi:hypothetical protein
MKGSSPVLLSAALLGHTDTVQSLRADGADMQIFASKNTVQNLRALFGQKNPVPNLRAKTVEGRLSAIHKAPGDDCNDIKGADDAPQLIDGDTPLQAFARSELKHVAELGHAAQGMFLEQLTVPVGFTSFVKVHEPPGNRARRRRDPQNRKHKSRLESFCIRLNLCGAKVGVVEGRCCAAPPVFVLVRAPLFPRHRRVQGYLAHKEAFPPGTLQ